MILGTFLGICGLEAACKSPSPASPRYKCGPSEWAQSSALNPGGPPNSKSSLRLPGAFEAQVLGFSGSERSHFYGRTEQRKENCTGIRA